MLAASLSATTIACVIGEKARKVNATSNHATSNRILEEDEQIVSVKSRLAAGPKHSI